MFSQACVILFTGGSASVHAGIPHPLEQTPPPREQTPPRSRPPGADILPRAEHAGRYGQGAGGTHSTGMQSCFFSIITAILIITWNMPLINLILFFEKIHTVYHILFSFRFKISTEKRTFLNLSSFASDNTKYHIKKNNDLILKLAR